MPAASPWKYIYQGGDDQSLFHFVPTSSIDLKGPAPTMMTNEMIELDQQGADWSYSGINKSPQ